jgi:cytochrome c oxidase subunit II
MHMAPLLAATQNASMFDPVSPPAESIRNVAILALAVTGFIFVIVEGVLLYCLIHFRRSRRLYAGEPPQIYGSMPIEIAWTVGPLLIVFVLVLVTARSLWEINVDAPAPRPGDNALFVTVIGRQWWWEYTYDHYNGREYGFTTANELHIPAGDGTAAHPVYLTLKSADVCHSYWVPRLAGKTDLIPGRTNHMWFQTDSPGLYVGQCAEFCGSQHANMLLRVVVDPPDEFAKWLDHEKDGAAELPQGDSRAQEGRVLYLKQSCVNCHRIRGVADKGTYAPDLTHLMRRKTLASGMIENNEDNLKAWVRNPQKIKAGCLMPAFGLSDAETDQIAAYLETLH